MKYRIYGLIAVAMGIFFVARPLVAHHEVLAKFDDKKPMTLKGTVTKLDWANPHVHIFMNVQNRNTEANWAVELESPVDLGKGGWNRETVKPGDSITVQGIAARNGSRQVWANSVVLASTNKKVFDSAVKPQPAANAQNGPTPKWPDGQPRLGPPPGQTGFWAAPTMSSLVQEGAKINFDAYGLLKNVSDASKVAPFQKWALDLYELRQKNLLKDDPMYLYCMPPGGPRQFQQPYGIQFNEDRDRRRIFVLLGSGNRNYRIIYTDGRPQRGQIRGDADNPLYYGRAVGQWEGDTLVVDTKGFNEKFWFSNGGLPHTDKLHLIERFTRTDLNTLKYEVTVDDPGAYTQTWKSTWDLKWIAGEELPVYYCQDNRP